MINRIEDENLPAGTSIRIGIPAERPEEAIELLVRLFSKKNNVVSARLGLMEIFHPEGRSEFTYTIGVQCAADERNTLQEVAEALRTVPTGRWPISVVPPTSQYFSNDAIVFFRRERKPRSWFSDLFRRK